MARVLVRLQQLLIHAGALARRSRDNLLLKPFKRFSVFVRRV